MEIGRIAAFDQFVEEVVEEEDMALHRTGVEEKGEDRVDSGYR
jgi:hypothetical protein